MSTVGAGWPSPSTPRTAGSGGGESEPTSASQGEGVRPGAARRRPTKRWSRDTPKDAEEALGQALRDSTLSRTITCRCCGMTAEVPLQRRFLCDACFRD